MVVLCVFYPPACAYGRSSICVLDLAYACRQSMHARLLVLSVLCYSSLCVWMNSKVLYCLVGRMLHVHMVLLGCYAYVVIRV